MPSTHPSTPVELAIVRPGQTIAGTGRDSFTVPATQVALMVITPTTDLTLVDHPVTILTMLATATREVFKAARAGNISTGDFTPPTDL